MFLSHRSPSILGARRRQSSQTWAREGPIFLAKTSCGSGYHWRNMTETKSKRSVTHFSAAAVLRLCVFAAATFAATLAAMLSAVVIAAKDTRAKNRKGATVKQQASVKQQNKQNQQQKQQAQQRKQHHDRSATNKPTAMRQNFQQSIN